MQRSMLGRSGLFLLAVVGALAMSSASALAAGTPTEVAVHIANPDINNVEVYGTVNPNGAATTAKIEYRKSYTGEWSVASSTELGSGGTAQPVSKVIGGLAPATAWDYRISGTNSYGTTYSPLTLGYTEHQMSRWWEVGKPKTYSFTFTSEGTAVINYRRYDVNYKRECSATGSGTLNTEGAAGDSYNKVRLFNCVVYKANGEKLCNAPELELGTIDGGFNPSRGPYGWRFCTGEEFGASITLNDPFLVDTPYETAKVNLPVTLTTTPYIVSASNVTFSLNMTWSLTGADVGKSFGAHFAS